MDPSQPESLFERFFKASPDLLGFLDRNGHFLKINPTWTHKTGFEPAELIGQFFYDHIPGEERDTAHQWFDQFKVASQVDLFKTNYDRKDGTKLFLEWQCISLDPMSPIFLTAYDLTALMQSEKALSESRENYRLLSDCVSEGVVLSEDDIIIEANKAFSRMAWMEPEEVIGKNIAVLVPPDHRKRLLEDLLEGYEITGIRKNGTVYPLEVRMHFIEYHGRKIRVNLLRDIQDKKRLLELSKEEGERALKAQEKVFSALTAHTREVIAIVDAEGRLKYSGGGNEGVLGYGLGENIGRSLFELIHPEDVERQKKRFAELIKKPEATETAYFRLKHKNGKWHHMEVTAHNLLMEPTVRGVVCNVRDVSDKIHAQKRLMESERFHRALFENALDVVFIQEPDGILRYISPSIRAVLGLEPSDLIGQNVFDYLHPEDRWEGMEQMKKLASGEQTRATFEQRMRHQNGSWRNVEWICQNLLRDTQTDADNHRHRTAGSSIDIKIEQPSISNIPSGETFKRSVCGTWPSWMNWASTASHHGRSLSCGDTQGGFRRNILEPAEFLRSLAPVGAGYGTWARGSWRIIPLLPQILRSGYIDSDIIWLWINLLRNRQHL